MGVSANSSYLEGLHDVVGRLAASSTRFTPIATPATSSPLAAAKDQEAEKASIPANKIDALAAAEQSTTLTPIDIGRSTARSDAGGAGGGTG
jgi:hypothetical protein